MRFVWIVAMLAACGRIGFESPARVDAGADTDADRDADVADDGDAASGLDGETCMTARAMAIGETRASESLATATSDHPSACGAGPDLVYRFEQPTQGTRRLSFRSDFRGVFWLATSCPPATSDSCMSFGQNAMLDRVYAAGVHYLVVAKVGGTGATFSISLD